MAKIKSGNGERHVLSKTSFIKSLQCQKQLYLYKNRYFLRDKLSPKQLAIFSRGHSIGKLAWELFPGGINAAPKSSMQYDKALALTQQLVFQQQPVVYEASFRFNQCLSILDILVNHDGALEAYEVKSSLSITETYLMDAAFQYYVMHGAGYAPKRFSLIFVNKDYRYQPEFHAEDYFIIEEVTEQVIALQPLIHQQVELAKSTLDLPNSPITELGLHCETPYKCDFVGFCRKKLSQPNVFSLTDITSAEQYALYQRHQISLDQISEEDLESPTAKIQLSSHRDKQLLLDLPEMADLNPDAIAYWIWESPALPIIEHHTPYTPVLLGFAIKKLNQPVPPEFHFFRKTDNYPEYLARIEKITAGHRLISYDLGDYSSVFDGKAPISLLEWAKNKRFYHPGMMGDYELDAVVKSCLPDVHFPDSTGKITHNEFLKTELWKARAEERAVSDEALHFIENQLLKIESLWNFLAGMKR
jgi:hypothetical protein